MIRNLVNYHLRRPHVTPSLGRGVLSSSGKTQFSNSLLMHQEPILHQRNTIATSRVLSSNNDRPFPFQSRPSQSVDSREWVTSAPNSSKDLERNESIPIQREPDYVDELAVEQPQLTLYEKRDGLEIHAVRFQYSTTMKSVFIEYAKKKSDTSTYALYDWANKTSYRATIEELGILLTVLGGSASEVEVKKALNDKGIAVSVKLCKIVGIKSPSYSLQISKMVHGKQSDEMVLTMNESDAIIVTEFIRCSIRWGLGFSSR